MNEEYVTIKKADYEQLIDKYIYFEFIQNRAAHIKTYIKILEDELKLSRKVIAYTCFKKKLNLEIDNLCDTIWKMKNRYEELTWCDYSDDERELAKQKFPIAENSIA